MGTKVELHQFIDCAVDIHERKSTVNFVYLNRVLHELVKHCGISNLEILLDDSDTLPPPKQTLSLPSVTTADPDGNSRPGSRASTTPSRPDSGRPISGLRKSGTSVLSEQDNKLMTDLKTKVSGLERKMSTLDELIPDEKKELHSESMIGDMWNYVNLGKRVDGCEETLEKHAKLLDNIRKEIKDLNSYKFYLDQLKENSTMDLRAMIDGLVGDMGEKTKKMNKMSDQIKTLEKAKPDEALAQELAKKVEGLIKLKDEIDGKISNLPTKADIENIHETFVTWIGLDEILRNYKPPRTPVPPSREGIAALQKAGELDQKTDDLGNKLSGLTAEITAQTRSNGTSSNITDSTTVSHSQQQSPTTSPSTVATKMDAEGLDAKIEEAFKQKRPASSRTELAKQHFSEALQDLHDRIDKLENEQMSLHGLMETPFTPLPVLPPIERKSSDEFGGKALPEDLAGQLAALQKGVMDALAASELIGAISEENETNKSAIAELNGQIEDLLDRYKILQDSIDNAPKGTADIDSAALQALRDTITALKEEQEIHHDQLNRLSDDVTQKDLHLKTLYSGVDDLREMKADKDFVMLEMEDKADKRSVDHKANRVFVDNHFEKLNSGLEAALKRCEGQEEALKHAINQISTDVDGKLDRMELQSVKDFLEQRLSKLKTGPEGPAPQPAPDMDAAGMRRRLLKFHCISCDRPVEVNSGNMLPSTMPVSYGFPGMRSNRPYTTYELELIRQHQRNLLHNKNSDPYDMPPTNRSCGGQHTMTYSHRRTRISALRFRGRSLSMIRTGSNATRRTDHPTSSRDHMTSSSSSRDLTRENMNSKTRGTGRPKSAHARAFGTFPIR